MAAKLTLGMGVDAPSYCLAFSDADAGVVVKDTPAVNGGSGMFKAQEATAVAVCSGGRRFVGAGRPRRSAR